MRTPKTPMYRRFVLARNVELIVLENWLVAESV
jgi:hypothetical protein